MGGSHCLGTIAQQREIRCYQVFRRAHHMAYRYMRLAMLLLMRLSSTLFTRPLGPLGLLRVSILSGHRPCFSGLRGAV